MMDPGIDFPVKTEIPELPDFSLGSSQLVDLNNCFLEGVEIGEEIQLGPQTTITNGNGNHDDNDHDHVEVKEEVVEEDEGTDESLEIGSRNSAFQPYKPLTILTNLQRGNVKTLCRDTANHHPLTFQEKAAKGSLGESDINDSNVNNVDSDGLSALMWASFHGTLNTIELLVNKGADVNCVGPDGQSSLMYAAAKGHVDVVNYLLSTGAELEGEDDEGNTALIHAAHYNQTAVVKELLGHGASMTKPNLIGDNAFDIAFKKGHRASQYAMEVHLKKWLETNCIE